MSLKFFTVPARHPEPAASELNQCLATQRVSHVERHFVADGQASCWEFCVTLVDNPPGRRDEGGDAAARKRGAVDWRDVLRPDEFSLYDRLRSARRQVAEAEGLPTYAVFTNEQLAGMVQARVSSAAALRRIDGVGEGRVSRYGETFLALLREGVPLLGPATTTAADGPDAAPAAAPPPPAQAD